MNLKPLIEWILARLPAPMRNRFWLIYSRDETRAALERLKDAGLSPKVIVDCGAFRGNWTRQAKQVFPRARILMVEAQPAKQAALEQVCSDFNGSVDYALTLIGPTENPAVTFYEMETGSSVLEELSELPRKAVTRPMTTLDLLIKKRNLGNVDLLKLDLQGYELEAIKGAREILRTAEVVYMEVSLLPYNKNAPLFDEVIAFMKNLDFLLYDCINLRRWEDGNLLQCDALFAQSSSRIRKIDLRSK